MPYLAIIFEGFYLLIIEGVRFVAQRQSVMKTASNNAVRQEITFSRQREGCSIIQDLLQDSRDINGRESGAAGGAAT